MVICVEKGQWLLLEHKKDGVQKFKVLCQVVELVMIMSAMKLLSHDYLDSRNTE